MPDISFWIDITPEESVKRTSDRDSWTQDQIDSINPNSFPARKKWVDATLLPMRVHNPDFYVIDGMRDESHVFNSIMSVIYRFL